MLSVSPLARWQPRSRWRLRELVSEAAIAERARSLLGQQPFVEKTSSRGMRRRKLLRTIQLVQALFPIICGAVSMFCSICQKEASTLSLQLSSVAPSCLTICHPMDCSTPGLPVHHQLLEFTQTHVHRVSDAIQPSHPLSSPSPPALNISQHQGLF